MKGRITKIRLRAARALVYQSESNWSKLHKVYIVGGHICFQDYVAKEWKRELGRTAEIDVMTLEEAHELLQNKQSKTEDNGNNE